MDYIFDGIEFIDKLQKLSGIKTIRELARDFDDLMPTKEATSDPVKNWEAKIGRWKKGQLPSTDDLIALSKTYKCSIDYLLGLDDTEPESNNPQYDFLVAANQLATEGVIDYVIYRNTETVYDDSNDPFSDNYDPDKPISEPKEVRVFRPAIVIRDYALCNYFDNIKNIDSIPYPARNKILKELLADIKYKNPIKKDTNWNIYQGIDDLQK